ncbi:hypothetical protein PI124_g21950 [Phytophthora idaei]|nr:hypothetical protein PI125_g22706 [Phytophthora idaei]KAG3232969.1 hypothetical protein PI124_g21950 [Phytophthora idaei]
MCNAVREGRECTCFQIWHLDWNNGNDIHRRLEQEHTVRERGTAQRPGKKRRRRVQAAGSDAPMAASGGSGSEASRPCEGGRSAREAVHTTTV